MILPDPREQRSSSEASVSRLLQSGPLPLVETPEEEEEELAISRCRDTSLLIYWEVTVVLPGRRTPSCGSTEHSTRQRTMISRPRHQRNMTTR